MFFRKRRTRFGNDDENVCSICLERLHPESTTTTVCGHKFCKSCIDRWNNRPSATCPNCRARLNPVVERTARRYSPYEIETSGRAPEVSASNFDEGDDEIGLDGNTWMVARVNGRRRWVPVRRVIDNVAPRRLFRNEFGKRKIKKELTIVEIKKMERYLKTV
jgi:hypothetical protein